MEKEIIGYKFIKPEMYKAASMILYGNEAGSYQLQNKPGWDFDEVDIKKLKTAGVLDLWFEPIYKKEAEFVPGKWYLTTLGSIYFFDRLTSYGSIIGYGVERGRRWKEGNICTPKYLQREATKEEIEKVLIDEAKRRYSIGDKFKSVIIPSGEFVLKGQNFTFLENAFFSPLTTLVERETSGILFHKGKWAKIVESRPEPKFKEGDLVQICSPRKDTLGVGYCTVSGRYEEIDAIGGRTERITKPQFKNGHYYYSFQDMVGEVAEYCLTKVNESKIAQFGNYQVSIHKGYILADGEKFSNEAISELMSNFEDITLKGHDVTIKEFKVGCTRGKMSEFQHIYNNLIW